jgi:DNA-binding winged helix-turn-helix (wHTH) protein
MGILSYAATPAEATTEISSLYRAVLVLEPATLPDPAEFVCELRKYAEHIPIFSMSESGPKDEYAHLFDMSFKIAISSASFATKAAEYSIERDLPYVGDYRLAGFNATPGRASIKYFGEDFELTKTETMIFRYLIRSYPIPQSSESIIKYAFPPSRHPDPSCVKTHISVINKKFREREGRKLLIMLPSKGYVVNTAEIIEKLKSEASVQAR